MNFSNFIKKLNEFNDNGAGINFAALGVDEDDIYDYLDLLDKKDDEAIKKKAQEIANQIPFSEKKSFEKIFSDPIFKNSLKCWKPLYIAYKNKIKKIESNYNKFIQIGVDKNKIIKYLNSKNPSKTELFNNMSNETIKKISQLNPNQFLEKFKDVINYARELKRDTKTKSESPSDIPYRDIIFNTLTGDSIGVNKKQANEIINKYMKDVKASNPTDAVTKTFQAYGKWKNFENPKKEEINYLNKIIKEIISSRKPIN